MFIKLFSKFVKQEVNLSVKKINYNNRKNLNSINSTQECASIDINKKLDEAGIFKYKNENLPLKIDNELKYTKMYNPKITPPREVWLEDFTNLNPKKLAILKLNPKIFAEFPRTNILYENINWQKNIHKISFLSMKVRGELFEPTKKPWPQKGTGKARHGSKTSPQWIKGEWVHGPRGPITRYYLLPYFKRIHGLTTVLSSKLAQNDLKIIHDLESFEYDNGEILEEALKNRGWGPSALIVDTVDIFPKKISLATNNVDHVNLMPLYGLNIHSMLKHETLILTLNALNKLQDRLLFNLNRIDLGNVCYKHEAPKIIPDDYPEFEGVRWWTNLAEEH